MKHVWFALGAALGVLNVLAFAWNIGTGNLVGIVNLIALVVLVPALVSFYRNVIRA